MSTLSLLFVASLVSLVSCLPYRQHDPRDIGPKSVFAHVMVDNTGPYGPSDWLNDINLAYSSGIDAFALNVGNVGFHPQQVANAYAAAEGTNFKLFLSFDMTAFSCSSTSDAQPLRQYLTTYASHPAQFMYQGQMFISSFSGDQCTFGTGDPVDGWTSVVKNGLPPTHFVPSFFQSIQAAGSAQDGDFNWNGAWPMGDSDVSFSSDQDRINQNNGKTYMASVSPLFFTHYGPQSYNKNFIYRSDDWLFNSRWDQLISNAAEIDLVEIITWNDYGESHYVGPIEGTQPGSQAWVNGFDHTPFLGMLQYYATAFKTGSYPDIIQDTIYLWARPYPAEASASNDNVGPPANQDWTQDYLWAAVFATAPAYVTLSSGSTSQSFNVQAGVTKLQLASSPGQQSAQMVRGIEMVAQVDPSAFQFQENPSTYNFNYFIASSGSGS